MDAVTIDGCKVPREFLRKKKELGTSYVLWLVGGAVGAHLFYLDRVVHGTCAVFTLNFFFFGWIADAFLMSTYLNACNRQAAADSVNDRTFTRLIFRLPLVVGVFFVSILLFFLLFPRMVHNIGVLDVDQAVAGTKSNPYDILGVPHGSPVEVATPAYHEKMRQAEPDPSCIASQHKRARGAGCSAKAEQAEELTKAFAFIQGTVPDKKRKGKSNKKRKSEGGGKQGDWADRVSQEWDVLFEQLKKVTAEED